MRLRLTESVFADAFPKERLVANAVCVKPGAEEQRRARAVATQSELLLTDEPRRIRIP